MQNKFEQIKISYKISLLDINSLKIYYIHLISDQRNFYSMTLETMFANKIKYRESQNKIQLEWFK